jgi:isoleucyl-tRNA synthetase
VELVLGDRGQEKWIAAHADLITDELNVKRLEFAHQPEKYVDYEIKPNFRAIGPKFGRLAPGIKKALASADAARLRAELDERQSTSIHVDGQAVDLTPDDVQVHVAAKPGWTAAQGRGAVVILSTDVTDELKLEGIARELIHHIQQIRKDLSLDYTDRIRVHAAAEGDVAAVCERFGESIRHETLAEALETSAGPGAPNADVSIEGHATRIWVSKV